MTELLARVDTCRPDYCASQDTEAIFDEDHEPSELLERFGEYALYWQKIVTSAKRGIAIGESQAFNTVSENYSHIGADAQQ